MKKHVYKIWGLTEEQFKVCDSSNDYVKVVTDNSGNYLYAVGRYSALEIIKARLEALKYNLFSGYKYKFERVL